MARSGEFNTTARVAIAFVWMMLASAAAVFADDVRKWRDSEGNLHYSITGSEAQPRDDGERPILHGRTATAEETFSVESSLQRREIEKNLTAAGRTLAELRERLREAEAKTFGAFVPAVTGSSREAKASLEAQRDALLASHQFEQDKTDTLRRLRRRARDQLKAIVALWRDFEALDAKVIERYGKPPAWWRKRLDCGRCPTLAEAEQQLKRTPPAATSDPKAPEEDWSEEDDEEGWESAWE